MSNALPIVRWTSFFRCERYACTLNKDVCAARQDELAGGRGHEYKKFTACQNCEQGLRIKEKTMTVGETTLPAEQEEAKTCRKCGELKPLEEFNKDSRAKGGRANKCRSCLKVYHRDRYAKKNQTKESGKQDRPAPTARPALAANTENGKALAAEHWTYIEGLLKLHNVEGVEAIGHHYKTAFIHGYKHAVEDLSI